MSNPYDMFKYWEEKKGLEEAIHVYCPELLDDEQFVTAYTNMKAFRKLMDLRVAELCALTEDKCTCLTTGPDYCEVHAA